MNIFSRHKNILFAVIGLVLIFFAYWFFVLSKKSAAQTNASGGALVKTTDAASNAQAANKGYDRVFVAGLLSLNSINIDLGIFESEAFKRLSFPEKPFANDYNIPYGRQNPFLPIDVNAEGISPLIVTQYPGGSPSNQPATQGTSPDLVPVNPATTTVPAVATTTAPRPTQRR